MTAMKAFDAAIAMYNGDSFIVLKLHKSVRTMQCQACSYSGTSVKGNSE